MRTSLLLLTGLFACFSAYSQSPSNLPEKIRQVETNLLPILIVEGDSASQFSLDNRMKHYKVPGVSIAVIRNGKIDWAKGYGFADQETKRRVDTTTLFQASSISKPVATFAALHWVEAGKFALDSNINKYLKDWQIPASPLTATEKVTLRRLMTNTSGLTVHGFAGYTNGKPVPTLIQILNGESPANSRAIELDTIPGKVNRNPGGGYVVLQKAMIDQIGKPFPEIMQETVLSKLRMSHSTFEQPLPTRFDSVAATGYTSYGQPVNGSRYTYPEMAAAGLWSTPSDLARYLVDVQQALQGKSSNVISQPMAKQMLTKHLGSMGLGPALRNDGDSLIFSQSGGNQGFRCLFMAHANKGDGVVIMTNADSGMELAQELLNSVSAAYNWDFSIPKRMKKAKLTSAQIEQVLGNYRRDRYIFEVTQTDGKLYAKPRWEEESREMIPEDRSQFIMRDGQRAEFIYDGDAKVKAVKLFGNVIFTKMK